ncbi:hypothetical protein JAAARDRAFT_45398 [Jaapia argillacea MUCL 33604]|uniref:ADP-ribosylglycohydrolase n=1 Tax=Jaapia argillacea MUCL 33604 TaxID=933084 RepID=A0A067Q4S6_9AGAM|nr:hypothetical protein JAAARDRAFT_45398 [Jaapia argillacea MUCL 33604]
MFNPTTRSRITGSIFGAALGDAIGLYTEFLSRKFCLNTYPSQKISLVPPITPMKSDGHRDKFDPRGWTDDMDHVLVVLLSWLENGKKGYRKIGNGEGVLDEMDVARGLREWCESGLIVLGRPPYDIGITVGKVVFDKNFLKNPQETAYHHWAHSKPRGAANGSLMRTPIIGVIALLTNLTRAQTFAEAHRISSITHADARCTVSCAIVTELVRGLCKGEMNDETGVNGVVEEAWTYIQAQGLEIEGGRDEFERYAYLKDLGNVPLDDWKMGYVYYALGASLHLLRLLFSSGPSLTFEPLITDLIFRGGDADTNACIAGSILGAVVGYEHLPAAWKDGLKNREWLMDTCWRVCDGLP